LSFLSLLPLEARGGQHPGSRHEGGSATLEAQFVFAVEPLVQGFELLNAEGRERLTGTPRQIQELLELLDSANP
jgi:hypothetical protein